MPAGYNIMINNICTSIFTYYVSCNAWLVNTCTLIQQSFLHDTTVVKPLEVISDYTVNSDMPYCQYSFKSLRDSLKYHDVYMIIIAAN